MDSYKDFAEDIANKAGNIMRANFSLEMKKDWKEDNSPLTVTDTKVNSLVIEQVRKTFPGHGVLGEEGSLAGKSEYLWVLDPVDGTLPFSHGLPTFTFSLALTKNGESILGVIYDPMMDRMFTAQKGEGTFLNGKKVKVSSQKELSAKSILAVESRKVFARLRKNLAETNYYVVSISCITYSSMLIATGEFAGAIFGGNHPWDAAAVKIIIEEAGGICTDLAGNEQRYDVDINGFIASNKFIHHQLLKLVKSAGINKL